MKKIQILTKDYKPTGIWFKAIHPYHNFVVLVCREKKSVFYAGGFAGPQEAEMYYRDLAGAYYSGPTSLLLLARGGAILKSQRFGPTKK